jgi:transcription-repair coupling factor (superfamily II helicase)
LYTKDLTKKYSEHKHFEDIVSLIKSPEKNHINFKNCKGSSVSFLCSAVFEKVENNFLVIFNEKEDAAFFYNDLLNILNLKEQILFFPSSYKHSHKLETIENENVMIRTKLLNTINSSSKKLFIVTYVDAVFEKIISANNLIKNTLKLHKEEKVNYDFIIDLLIEFDFERVDFVSEPGQFAVRGGIVDIFSYSHENPYRVVFSDDEVESIRVFDIFTQISKDEVDEAIIIPNISKNTNSDNYLSLIGFLPESTCLIFDNLQFSIELIEKFNNEAKYPNSLFFNENKRYLSKDDFTKEVASRTTIELGNKTLFKEIHSFDFNTSLQGSFNKDFNLLMLNLIENLEKGFINIISSENEKQIERLERIFSEINKSTSNELFFPLNIGLSGGFTDYDLKICCYTDHQIFERYYKYKINSSLQEKEAITLKELLSLKPGDYVTHIDHGIGRYGGLEKINNNGKEQEAIRLIYKDDDILYVSIHSLHKISKYAGKEGSVPTIHRLGSQVWQNLKNKTKERVKDIAKDLIKLYAERKASKGFAFSADNYLQNELEASFIYEDTPDQLKTTLDVKRDMESVIPMDRLVCGDVGFGKTEIAIRAAFKATCDSKQVAVLVPTTILALQHYKTFKERLAKFPCNVEYINRFKSSSQKKEIINKLKEGKLDIIIGTHRLISNDVVFKDLGLLIIDEEQKFGVAAKEKIRKMKANVDTLTLTATPIPRTLQFSLMGARDLSIINTPPPNRYPIQTEIHTFDLDIIRDAILYEVNRGGQVFFVHNRIQNIMEIYDVIHKLLPDIRIAVGHGQLDGHKLEEIMIDFIEGNYDVLLATTIIENGLDIPNANTIIINEAHNFGLSDLHQLRGRVGRSNKKSFCYLLAPPFTVLTEEARKRLKAIEEFSEIGSGFNIAMRDLDIRGAGDILGAEQSGFIADIGFDIYHKILDEAITELKETEFKELYNDSQEKEFVKDCIIETDLELLIPDYYVQNITERLNLYRELDSIEELDKIPDFKNRLIDKFGKIPKPTEELILTMHLRKIAKNLGFEKVVLKQQKMLAYFVNDKNSDFFKSDTFYSIIKYLQNKHLHCSMKENKEKLYIIFNKVPNVETALNLLSEISQK